MANLNVTGNFSTSADSINISYTTDAKNITKIELTKDNTNFITADSFTDSNATFNISAWDYGTYSCKLRMTHAQNPLTFVQYKKIGNNGEIVDTTDGQWWSIVAPHSVNTNTSYTVSLNHVNYVYVCFYDANGNYLSDVEANTSDWSVGQLTATFTTVANTAKILFCVTGDNAQPTVSISPNNPLITISNNFNIIITEPTTEPSEPSAPSTDPNTVIEITKAGVPLTPVNTTPTTGQYKVTIENTTNCTAILESDNKTITVTGASSNDGQIDIRVNIENKRIYTKSIAVANMLKTSIVSNKMSEVKQTADKINLLVQGETASELTMTDTFTELISNNITLTAEHINLNGYVSNNDANWSIDNEGNMRAENLKIEGEVGADTLSVNYIDNPCYPATLAGSIDLYVNTYSGNDDYTIDDILQSYDEAEEQNNDSLKKKFESIQGAIDAIPKFLNNKTVHITMETNSTEDVYIRSVVGGAIRLYMNGRTLYGTLRGYACSATVSVYGGTKDSTEEAVGIIHPNIGIAFASRAVSVGFEACQYAALYKLKIYAPDAKPSTVSSDDKVCVASQSGTGNVYCKNIQIVNAVVGFRANNTGIMHVNTSSGIASKYGFQSTTGGIISLANNNQCGGETGNTNKSSGGQIWYDTSKVTFAAGNQTTESGSAPTVSTTKTITIKSSYGDTYRSSVYNNWKKDGTCRQGDYGYGDCTGCWFFGSAFAELKGKTISKVQITITRNSGGSYSAVGLVVRTHNYSARPSGAPKLSSSSYGTLSLAVGETDKLTITHSDVLNGIENGTIKGFGIRTTYDAAHYAVCSGSVTVKITYTE